MYPDTDILINKLNTRDHLLLGDLESASILDAIYRGISPGKFDLPHLKNIHKELFQELYAWAGQIRTVDITKGDSTFCRSDYIENEANKLLSNLATKDQYLTKYKDKDKFVQKFADYYCEINVIHPFREGNGRASRVFFEQLAQHNSYTLDFSSVSKSDWINASIDGFNCDNSKLESILSEALQPIEAHQDISNPKYLLSDHATGKQVGITNNADVLKYFEKYDSTNQIASWLEAGKIKTQTDFHYLENENPERVASVLNYEFKTDITVIEVGQAKIPDKIEVEVEL